MVQQITDQFWHAEARTEGTKQFIRDIKRLTRHVLCLVEGFHGGCKERLTRDSIRGATRSEVQGLGRENARLKTLVAELSLEVHVLKKTDIPDLE